MYARVVIVLFPVRLVMQTWEGLIWTGRVLRQLSDYVEDTVFTEMPLSQQAGQALAFSAFGAGTQLSGAQVLVPASARGVSLDTYTEPRRRCCHRGSRV